MVSVLGVMVAAVVSLLGVVAAVVSLLGVMVAVVVSLLGVLFTPTYRVPHFDSKKFLTTITVTFCRYSTDLAAAVYYIN